MGQFLVKNSQHSFNKNLSKILNTDDSFYKNDSNHSKRVENYQNYYRAINQDSGNEYGLIKTRRSSRKKIIKTTNRSSSKSLLTSPT